MGLTRRQLMAKMATAAAVAATPSVFAQSNATADIVEQIRNALMDGQPGIAATLARLVSEPGKIQRALGTPTAGGITPLYNDFQITILNIVWAPNMVLRPHDHNMWASIGVYGGREDNMFWKTKDGSIEVDSAASFGTGEVGSLSKDAIHSVINPTQKLTAAIHVYGGNFFAPGRKQWEGEDLIEKPFDQPGLIQHFKDSNRRFPFVPA